MLELYQMIGEYGSIFVLVHIIASVFFYNSSSHHQWQIINDYILIIKYNCY